MAWRLVSAGKSKRAISVCLSPPVIGVGHVFFFCFAYASQQAGDGSDEIKNPSYEKSTKKKGKMNIVDPVVGQQPYRRTFIKRNVNKLHMMASLCCFHLHHSSIFYSVRWWRAIRIGNQHCYQTANIVCHDKGIRIGRRRRPVAPIIGRTDLHKTNLKIY